MTAPYENHVFVSYAREQRAQVDSLVNELRKLLTVWWDRDIEPGENWSEKVNSKIRKSRHFLLYCNIEAKASETVGHEIKTFREDAAADSSRKLFVLLAPGCENKHVPSDLGEVQYVRSIGEVIIYVLK